MDVTDATFAEEVIERSRKTPVLVDFWAPWCGPCRMVGPVLEKLAAEDDAGFVLAKLNTDENQETAARYQIRGIPDIRLFVGGALKAGFVGAQPEAAVREFLREHLPSEADELVLSAVQVATEQPAQAREKLERAVELDPKHNRGHLALAGLDIAEGLHDDAVRHLDAVSAASDEYEIAMHLRELIGLAEECTVSGGEAACRAKLESAPDDLDARFDLGACLAIAGRYEEALEEFLAIVAQNRHHRDEAARKAMLTVFGIVGVRSELADRYRRKLAIYL